MQKPPEEGKIWEWRAFGKLSPALLATVNSMPVRDGIVGRPDNDIYFVTPPSDHNIKLRGLDGRMVLKIKLLLESGPDSIELYEESSNMIYEFPVSKSVFDYICQLLNTSPPGDLKLVQSFGVEGFVKILSMCRPPAKRVEVTKTRSQYLAGDGWIELADMLFPHKRTQSISIHSYQKEAVVQILESLDVGNDLKVMNYVQACRMWG